MKRVFFLCVAGIILAGCSADPSAPRIKPVGPTTSVIPPQSGVGYPPLQQGSVPTR